MKPSRFAARFFPLPLLLLSTLAYAQAVGSVNDLSGLLTSRNAAGVTRVLAVNSQISEGDTLSTERNTYARVLFKDGAELILQPESVLVVTRYAYDAGEPQQDKVELGLAQGGLRSTAGKLAQRNADAMVINTPLGTLKGNASMVVALRPQEGKAP